MRKRKQLELPHVSTKARPVVEVTIADSDRKWFRTKRAAAYLDMSVKALLMAVSRGRIQPDQKGKRGRSREHVFSRETLDAYNSGSKAA